MVYCPKCGRKNPDDAVVCAYCGANIAEEKKIPEWESIDTRERREKVGQTKKGDNFLKIVGVILLFIIIVAVIGAVISSDSGENTTGGGKQSPIQADFTYSPRNPTTNDIIQFTDKSTSTEGSITSWYWEFDTTKQYTDDTSTLQNPTYRYQFGYGRTFSVKLTVTDNKGNSNSITKNIAIVHQSHVPQGNDITLEVLSHERKNYDLDGSSSSLDGWIFVWLTVKLTNNWDGDIIPQWSFGSPFWGDHFYIYTNYDPNDWWGYQSIQTL